MNIRRIVILGHTGFIGSAIERHLRRTRPDLEVVGLSLQDCDLTESARAASLEQHFDRGTAVIMCAAIKRQLGDTPEIYLRNMRIAITFAELIARATVARVVYFSSAAVYGEDVENLAIREDTPVQCRTYYGLSKFTSEWILEKAASGLDAVSLGILRPATVYGPGDLATAYGPSGFLDAAVHDRATLLWGDGTELREFVFIDDVARIAADYALMDHQGPLNVVAGRSYSFQDALTAVERAVGRRPQVSSRPRSKPKVDNRFDNRQLAALFPALTFTDLDAGVRLTYQRRYQRS